MASRNSFRNPRICRRSGFSRDPCIIENQGFRVNEAAFTATLASLKAGVRGESPSYRNHLFVGAALAATHRGIEDAKPEVEAPPIQSD
jgi:hypothetical protein